jgi:Predicted membrane protein
LTDKKPKVISIQLVFIWTLLFIFGLAFLLYRNTHEGMWLDESISYAYSQHSIAEILVLLKSDSHPPLYYIMLHLYTMVFGTSLFALRAFSAFGILALALLGAGPVRKLYGYKGGLIFSFLCFSTPICLTYGQEIRMYSWAAFFVTASALYGYISLKETNRKNLALFAITLVASGYTHYYGMIAAGLIGSIIFFMVLLSKDRKKIIKYLIILIISAILFLPWAIFLLGVASSGIGVGWISKLTPYSIFSTFSYPFGDKFAPPQPYSAIYTFFYSIILIGWGVYTGISKKLQDFKLVIIALIVYLGTIGCGIITSYLIRPSLVPKYMLSVLGLYLIAMVFSISKLRKYMFVLAFAVMVFFYFPQLTNIERNQYNGAMNDVAEYVKHDIKQDDVFIHTDIHTMGVFSYYFPKNKHFLYNKDLKENIQNALFGSNVTEGPNLKEFIKGRVNIWLVNDFNENGYSDKWIRNGDIKLLTETKSFNYSKSWFSVSVCRVESCIK